MKNLNALVEAEKKQFSHDFRTVMFSGMNPTDQADIYFQERLEKFARKVAETALKECRPGEKEDRDYIDVTLNRDVIDKIMYNHDTAPYQGYNQCLSDYDERVKNYLK